VLTRPNSELKSVQIRAQLVHERFDLNSDRDQRRHSVPKRAALYSSRNQAWYSRFGSLGRKGLGTQSGASVCCSSQNHSCSQFLPTPTAYPAMKNPGGAAEFVFPLRSVRKRFPVLPSWYCWPERLNMEMPVPVLMFTTLKSPVVVSRMTCCCRV